MNIIDNRILSLPEGLSSTSLYKLLKLFDEKMIAKYNQEFTPDDEYNAIKDCVRYFYTNPERTESGEFDKEACEIDLNFLSMLILSGKSTRDFIDVLIGSNGTPLFNIEGNKSDFIEIKEDAPFDITVNVNILEADDISTATKNLTNMISHLLYFHNLSLKIGRFTQDISIADDNSTYSRSDQINATYYEPHS